jgi:hypothetical protein
MAIKDRDYRSRALRRNLRKQARKGQLTSREKKELLEQEAAFRDARRGRAPIVGGALAALGGALTIPGVQAALGGMLDRGEITEDEAKALQNEADKTAATGEPTKDPVAAAIENAMPAADVVADADMVETEKPSPAEEALMKRRGVAPSATDVEGLESRGLGEMTYSVPRQQLIDQLTGAFEASRGGGTVAVPEYDDDGNVIYDDDGNVVVEKEVPIDEFDVASDAVRRLKALEAGSEEARAKAELSDQERRDAVEERAMDVESRRVEPLSRRGPSLITDAERERVSSQSEDARRRDREASALVGAELDRALAGLPEGAGPRMTAPSEILSGSGLEELGGRPRLTSPNNPLSRRVQPVTPQFAGQELGVQDIPMPEEDFRDEGYLRTLSPRAAGNIPARFGGDLAQIGRRSPSTIPSSMIDQLRGSTLDPRLARSLDMLRQTQERGGMVSKKEALMKKIRAKYGIR